MCSLGNRMNQVYAQVTEVYNEQLQMKSQMAEIMAVQQQTIQALGGFVTKLNEKIESVDNFHMLITEIQQGHYQDESQLYSLCCVLAQLDKRTLEDDRKLNILKDALTQSEIISENGISIQQYLMDILSLSDDKVGIVYLELCNFRNSFPANLFAKMIETYHFLPKMEKMSKSKEILIQELLSKYKLDASAEFSFSDVSESFLENKQNGLVNLELLEMKVDTPDATEVSKTEKITDTVSSSSNDKLKEAENLFMNGKFAESFPIFEELANQGNGRAMYFMGEFYINGYGIEKDKPLGEFWRFYGAKTGDPLCKLKTANRYNEYSDFGRAIIHEVQEMIVQLAEKGDPFAQYEIGAYHYHLANKEKYGEPTEWFKKSAECGYFLAEFHLAVPVSGHYYNLGEEKLKWLKSSAEKGYAPAQYGLGHYYEDNKYGSGQQSDYEKEAFKWYSLSANQGYIHAMRELAECYRLGRGTSKSGIEGRKWQLKFEETQQLEKRRGW